VPPGFKIELFAEVSSGARIIRTAPNGDIFVAETRAAASASFARPTAWPKATTNEIFAADFTSRSGSRSFQAATTRNGSMSPTPTASCALPITVVT